MLTWISRKQYHTVSVLSMVVAAIVFFNTMFTSFTLPFTTLYVGKGCSVAIFILICVAWTFLNYSMLRPKQVMPTFEGALASGIIPVIAYCSIVMIKYSKIMLFVCVAVLSVSVGLYKTLSVEKKDRHLRRQIVLYSAADDPRNNFCTSPR